MGTVCPVSKMEKFLVTTDGSEFSQNAAREAINLAGVCSSKLVAISVVPTNPEFENTIPQIIEKAEKNAGLYLEAIRTRASEQGVPCETIIVRGDQVFQSIVDVASKNQADMIIMGTHGRTGLNRLMMGSITAKVIGHAPCNVLVVPLNSKIECKNLLIATDGSRYSDAAASEAIGIARRCESALIAMSVAFTDEEIESLDETAEIASAEERVGKVVGLAEKEGIKAEGLLMRGNPYKAIVEASIQKRADLIILGTHGRTGLERLLMGSVTERVIGHAGSAVLVVKI